MPRGLVFVFVAAASTAMLARLYAAAFVAASEGVLRSSLLYPLVLLSVSLRLYHCYFLGVTAFPSASVD